MIVAVYRAASSAHSRVSARRSGAVVAVAGRWRGEVDDTWILRVILLGRGYPKDPGGHASASLRSPTGGGVCPIKTGHHPELFPFIVRWFRRIRVIRFAARSAHFDGGGIWSRSYTRRVRGEGAAAPPGDGDAVPSPRSGSWCGCGTGCGGLVTRRRGGWMIPGFFG
jgi:hypothetical protein